MSVPTFAITVVSTGGGNKYFIDGVQQKTLNLIEGKTYEFDQSDSSNSSHPLRFSTTSDGSHNSGSEYTTGVSTNGTPGSAGAYTRITVASSAPTLYYYCTAHSGMGGQANTLSSSVTRAYDVTVVSTDSGNKYFIDGIQQDTLNLVEGHTYYLDQSASTNSNHPLRFSTTSDGTHSGGSEYTTGVTTGGTPGSAGAYTQITVAASAPTLYYYCTQHSGMGGQANTVDDDTWGVLYWGTNEWGDQGPIEITLSGQSTTSSVGSLVAAPSITIELTGQSTTSSVGSPNLDLTTFVSLTAPSGLTSAVGSLTDASNVEGWGRQAWGNSGWGVEYSVALTGLSTTSSVGSVTAVQLIPVPLTGVSTTSSLGSPTVDALTLVTPTGLQAQTELGSFDNAGTLVGWGRNGWGEEPYGDSFNKLEQPAGLSATSSVGALTLDLTSVISPTGVSSTSSVGSLSFVIDATIVPTGVGATSSVGTISPSDSIGLTGLSSTSSVGSTTIETAYDLTGLSATSSVGSISITSSPIVAITGVSATSNVGSISPAEMSIGLTGLSSTASTGTITPNDVMGLTGLEAVASVNATGLILKYYGKIDPKTSTGYSTKTPKNTTGYTIKTSE